MDCIEDLAWLADEFLLPTSITNETNEQRFLAVLDQYNQGRPAERQFEAGYITNVSTSALCKWNTQYDWSILDCIRNCICKDSGYVRVRRTKTAGVVHRYIDIVRLQDYGVQAEQPITFGVNLIDYIKKMDMGNFTNALTPYGAEIEDEEVYEDYSKRLVGTPIEDSASIALYGRHAKAVIFDGVNNLNSLNALAQAYLTRYSQPQITMEIKALDLAEISNNAHFEIGDSIHIVAEPYGIDQWIYLTSRNIDLQDVSKNSITLSGHVTRGSTLTQQSVETADTVKDIPSKASMLDAAKRNALQMLLDETQGGYVVYEYHETNGKADYIEAINICDEPTITASKKRWRWSQNGLGYMYRDQISDPWQGPTVAITSDGKINASRILTGTLDADTVRVHGRIEATSGYIGDLSQGWDIGTSDIHNGVTGMNDDLHEGTYVGVDGIRFNQKPTDPTPLAYTKISRLGVDSQVTMTASGFHSKYGRAYLSGNDVAAINHGVLDSNGNLYDGKSTGAFSVKVYQDGVEKYIGLNFMNGILVGASNV